MESPVNRYTNCTDLQTGDILTVSGIIPFINHYAIVYKKDGVKYVAEIDLDVVGLVANRWKVISEPLEDYKKRRTITGFVRNEKTLALTDDYIQKKIVDATPSGFKFLGYNCEDFINGVCDCELGLDRMNKLAYLVAILVILILLYFIFR